MNALNAWKAVSIGLMVILASGLVTPRAYAVINQDILSIVQNIQNKVNSPTFGLQAINNKLNGLPSQSAIGNLQTSVNNLQTTANAIKTNTDNLPATPASQPVSRNINMTLIGSGTRIISAPQGYALTGHIYIVGAVPAILSLDCISPAGDSVIVQLHNTVNEDFTCPEIDGEAFSTGPVQVFGTVTYQITPLGPTIS